VYAAAVGVGFGTVTVANCVPVTTVVVVGIPATVVVLVGVTVCVTRLWEWEVS
jgi:hypothetical protein